jgi:hypothetical protein
MEYKQKMTYKYQANDNKTHNSKYDEIYKYLGKLLKKKILQYIIK